MTVAWRETVTRGDVAAVRALLQDGADVDARDRHGQTALMLAAHAGHDDVIAVLLEHGAALDVTAKFVLSALLRAAAVPARARRGTGAPGFAGKTAHDLALARDYQDLAAELIGPATPTAGS